MKNQTQISIVTVGMNHIHYLKSFLNSLFNLHRPTVSFEMIYVDNCSSDGSVDFIKQNYPLVKIIDNKKILGFGENNNKGAKIATGKYIAIMNPDVVFLKDSLDHLFNYSEKLDHDCILVPKLLNPDRSLQYSVRGFITPWVFLSRFITKGNDETSNKIVQDYLCKNIDTDKVQFVDWSIGAALFFKADLYRTLKGFDTAYFLYLEDVDICLRAWNSGNPVIYYPKSEIIHNHLRASRKLSKKMFMHLKSLFVYFFKNGFFVKHKRKQIKLDLPTDI